MMPSGHNLQLFTPHCYSNRYANVYYLSENKRKSSHMRWGGVPTLGRVCTNSTCVVSVCMCVARRLPCVYDTQPTYFNQLFN